MVYRIQSAHLDFVSTCSAHCISAGGTFCVVRMSKRNKTAETSTHHSKKSSAPRKAGKRPCKSGNAYALPAVPNAQSSEQGERRERVLSETNINGIMFYEMVREPIVPTNDEEKSSGEDEATAAVVPEQVPALIPIHEPWRERVEVQVPQALREAHSNKKYDYDRVADELIPRIIANPHLAITRPWEILEDYRRAENLSRATATRKVTKLSGTNGHVAGGAFRRTADNAGHTRASRKRDRAEDDADAYASGPAEDAEDVGSAVDRDCVAGMSRQPAEKRSKLVIPSAPRRKADREDGKLYIRKKHGDPQPPEEMMIWHAGGKGRWYCVHNCLPDQCKECGGSGICEHKRIRSLCKVSVTSQYKPCIQYNIQRGLTYERQQECGGASICVHKRERSKCKASVTSQYKPCI